MRYSVFTIVALAFAVSAGVLHAFQAGTPAPARQERIYFSALNREEKPVLGLSAADFELKVNGTVSSVEGFRPALPYTDRTIPLVAWILIDFNPNINAEVISSQAGAAAELLKILHPDSLVGVKMVSDRSETLAPLGHDPASLRKAFSDFGARRNTISRGGLDDAVPVGAAGIARAVQLALLEIGNEIRLQPALGGREVRRAVMILSDGNINPAYKTRPLYEDAGREGVYFYPVFMPRNSVGPWIEYFTDLAKKSGGVASSLGAIAPGVNPFKASGANRSENALSLNFIHMIRDLNGKYSVTLAAVPGAGTQVSIRCRIKDVRIRLPRKTLS